MDTTVTLKVNDQPVPLNLFVQTLTVNIVEALMESLDGIPADRRSVEIKIDKS